MTKDMEDPTRRNSARELLESISGKKLSDEQKHKLYQNLGRGAAAQAAGTLGARKDTIFHKELMGTAAGELVGKPGSLKSIHGAIERGNAILEAIRQGTDGAGKGLGPKHNSSSKSK
jgi:hypothetical protein